MGIIQFRAWKNTLVFLWKRKLNMPLVVKVFHIQPKL